MRAKKYTSLVLAIIMSFSFVACGSNAQTESKPKEEVQTESSQTETENTTQKNIEELCLGTWKWDFKNSESNDWGVETMELFKGGTGKGTNSLHTDGAYYPLKWEVKDDVLVVSFEADPLSCAFEIEEDTMTSTDGKLIYHKE